MNKLKKDEFFELLCLNNSEMLKDFLMRNGKSPKARCPISFMNINDADEVKLYGPFAVI